MALDVAVLGQDPRFRGGGVAMTDAFLAGVRDLGRDVSLLHDPHPGLGDARLSWRRIEGLRQLAAARRLEAAARDARSLWVAASLPQHGGAAPRSGRPYGCWVATTIAAEWRGRAPGLTSARRFAAGVSIPVLERLERNVLSAATALYTTSASSRLDVAAAAGRPDDEVGLLPIPVDTQRFTPADERAWREQIAGPVLAFVGRATDPRKNLVLLLDAFHTVRRDNPNAQLRLVGTPPDVAVPPGVDVVGEVADVAAELRRASIFVLPSLQEGFGIVAAEALATGLPVVSTPCGGPEELVRQSGGGIVVAGFEAADLAAAIQSLVDDVETAAVMRASGRAYVERVHAPGRFRELLAAALRSVDGC